MAALDDSLRPGKEPEITLEARAWLVSLACQKAKDAGYPHELWTTRLLARHAREHAPNAGHVCLARIAQGTVCKILAEQEVKPHKVRYYLERRDPAFDAKMAEVLCIYQASALSGTDPLLLAKTDPLSAQAFLTGGRHLMVSQGVMSRCDGSAQRQVSIPLFDWRDHPSVPTCPPRGVAASGGQGWPQATVLHGAQRP